VGSLLRSLVKKNIRDWDLVFPQAKFVYNHSTCQITSCSPFQVMYGQLDLIPLPTSLNYSSDAEERVKQLKNLHEQVYRV
jgi:hypothetical protein